jgi:hypothetical protein
VERQSHFSLERLCSRQQGTQNHPLGRRIPAPVSIARIAARLCAHPPLRLSCRTTAARAHGGLPSFSLSASTTFPSADEYGAIPHLAVPGCGGTMIIVEKLIAEEIRLKSAEWKSVNTSQAHAAESRNLMPPLPTLDVSLQSPPPCQGDDALTSQAAWRRLDSGL